MAYLLFINEWGYKMLQQYGFPIFLSLILLYLLFILVKWIVNTQNTQIKDLQDELKSIHDRFKEEDKIKETFSELSEDANKVQILIYHILHELNCGRISIFQYHNGGKTLNGVSFRKCTNTFESVSLKISPKAKELQNLPISINSLWNKLLVTQSPILLADIEDIKDIDSSVYTVLKIEGIKSYYSMLLMDFDNRPIGFMTIEFYENKVELDDEHIRDIKNHVQTISGLLS